jgi:hypothetical protein
LSGGTIRPDLPSYRRLPTRQEDLSHQAAYAIVPEGDPLFAFAGLWENWRDRAAGDGSEWTRTCTITGEPNELCGADPQSDAGDPAARGLERVARLGAGERGRAAGAAQAIPGRAHARLSLSTRVNSVKNDEASLLDAITAA